MFLGFLPFIAAGIGLASAVSGFLGQSSSKRMQKKQQALQLEQMQKEAVALEADKKFANQQVMLDFTKAKANAQQQQWASIYSAAFKEEQANLAAAQAASSNGASLFQVKQAETMALAESNANKQQTYNALSDETKKAKSTQNELQGASDQVATQAAMTGQNTSLAAAQVAERGQLSTEEVGLDNREMVREVTDELTIQSQYNERVAALQKELGISAVEAQAKLDEMGLGYAQMVASYSKTNAKTQRKQEVNSAKAVKNAALLNINASTDLSLSRNALQSAQIKGQSTGNVNPFGVLGAAANLYSQIADATNPVQRPIQVGSVNLGADLSGRNAGMFNQNPNVLNSNRAVSTYRPSTIYSAPPSSSTISTYPSTITAPPSNISTYPSTVNTLPPTR